MLQCALSGLNAQLMSVDQVDENENTGKVNLGLSVIVRVTLKDGSFHEVRRNSFGYEYNEIVREHRLTRLAGHWLWPH